MRASRFMRAAALVGGLALAVAACSSGAEAPAEEPAPAEGEAGVEEADGDYAFGTDRDQIAQAIAAPFADRNGSARWEGDTLILSLDGDATEEMAGFQECRVVSHLVNEGDLYVIEFPNGTVDCAQVLEN